MHLSAYLLLASLPALIQAHGGHGSSDDSNDAEEGGGWHARHMAEEHHIDAFDLESFFKLHDLNQDGILDHSELSAIYGLHHETSREKSQDEEQHKRKSEEIMSKVLSILDQNGDGLVTKTEFVSAGEKGLPEFSHHEGLGHHYDSEGEYFLHHEEMYHNTPETQTEESYNHPEDIAHFEHHEDIEREEEDKARKAQGLPATNPDIPLDDQTAQPDHDEIDAKLAAKAAGQQVLGGGASGGSSDNEKEEAARQARLQANKEATEKYNLSKQKQEAKARGAWGDNGEGFKKPKDKVDRLRDRIPYKYRVRSSFFGDF